MKSSTARRELSAKTDLAVLVLIAIALTAGLHLLGRVDEIRLDWSNPVGWLENARSEEAIAAVLRHVGLATGYWITASALLYAVSSLRSPGHRRGLIRWITLPAVRRIVDRALATALAASIAATPVQAALAEEPPPPAAVFDITTDGVPIPLIRLVDESETVSLREEPAELRPPTSAVQSLNTDPPALYPGPSLTTAAPATPTTSVASSSHTVRSGDNLWIIAENAVRMVQGVTPTDDITAVYWRELIAANRITLRSGDPNLIYPGEIISLPPVEVGP